MREITMTRSARWASIGLLLLVLIVGAGNLWATRSSIANQNRTYQNEQIAQQKQGQAIDRKICTDIRTMAEIQPPAGPAASNPSKAYEQAEHQAWSGLVLAVGCK